MGLLWHWTGAVGRRLGHCSLIGRRASKPFALSLPQGRRVHCLGTALAGSNPKSVRAELVEAQMVMEFPPSVFGDNQ